MAKRAEYLGPERRRPLVLDAAQAIFAEGGFADTSMSAIAERSGVSKAVLYDCFPGGKQEIYCSLLDRVESAFMNHMLDVLAEVSELPLEESLRRGLHGFLRFAERDSSAFRIIFGEAGTSDHEIASRVARTRERVVARMGERTVAILEGAGVHAPWTVEVYNRAIVSVAEELARWLRREPDLPRDEVVETVVTWFMKGFERIMPDEALDRMQSPVRL